MASHPVLRIYRLYASRIPERSIVRNLHDRSGRRRISEFYQHQCCPGFHVFKGIGGPVEFNLADGSYSTLFGLGAVPGASPVNTNTFQGNESDSTKVKLFNHGSWAVIALMGDGAAHFRFRKMHMEVDGTGDNVILWCYRTENTKDIVF